MGCCKARFDQALYNCVEKLQHPVQKNDTISISKGMDTLVDIKEDMLTCTLLSFTYAVSFYLKQTLFKQ